MIFQPPNHPLYKGQISTPLSHYIYHMKYILVKNISKVKNLLDIFRILSCIGIICDTQISLFPTMQQFPVLPDSTDFLNEHLSDVQAVQKLPVILTSVQPHRAAVDIIQQFPVEEAYDSSPDASHPHGQESLTTSARNLSFAPTDYIQMPF